VFMSQGITEVHHEPVSLILSDVSAKGPDYLNTQLLVLTGNLAKLFGVQACRPAYRVYLVTKHDCQMTTLGLGTSALFLLRQQRSAALATESESGGILKATLRTAETEQTGTLTTKLHSLGVLKPTAWALHDQNSLRRRLSRFSRSEVRVGNTYKALVSCF